MFQRQSWKCTTMSFTYWSVQGKSDIAQPMPLSFFFTFYLLPLLIFKVKEDLQLVHLKEIRLPTQNLEKMLRNHRCPGGVCFCCMHFWLHVTNKHFKMKWRQETKVEIFFSFLFSLSHTQMYACTHTDTHWFCKLKWIWTSLRIISQLHIFHFCGHN